MAIKFYRVGHISGGIVPLKEGDVVEIDLDKNNTSGPILRVNNSELKNTTGITFNYRFDGWGWREISNPYIIEYEIY